MTEFVVVEDLQSFVNDGMTVVVPNENAGVSMAATAVLARSGVKNLHLVCCPVSGIQADILIGCGCVGVLETSAISLGEIGPAPRFTEAVRTGGIRLKDATCPAVHAGLIAAQKGVSFLPVAGIVGSDLLKARPDWKLIDDPYRTGKQTVIVPAIVPDVAIFHAPKADRFGNVFIGRRRELATMAYASKATLVTVERIVEQSLLDDEDFTAGVLPSIYVSAIAKSEHGAWPAGLAGEYGPDIPTIARYAKAARSETGFQAFLAEFLGKREATV